MSELDDGSMLEVAQSSFIKRPYCVTNSGKQAVSSKVSDSNTENQIKDAHNAELIEQLLATQRDGALSML